MKSTTLSGHLSWGEGLVKMFLRWGLQSTCRLGQGQKLGPGVERARVQGQGLFQPRMLRVRIMHDSTPFFPNRCLPGKIIMLLQRRGLGMAGRTAGEPATRRFTGGLIGDGGAWALEELAPPR